MDLLFNMVILIEKKKQLGNFTTMMNPAIPRDTEPVLPAKGVSVDSGSFISSMNTYTI